MVAQVFERAVEQHKLGKKQAARELYGDVLAADPTHHRALYSLGVLALEEGQNGEAAGLFERAAEYAVDNVAYVSNWGEALRRAGKLQDATHAFMRAVALAPELAVPSYNLGVALEALGERELALPCFERCADLQPDSVLFQTRLGRLLEELQLPWRALGHYQCALALAANSAEAKADLVRVVAALGDVRARWPSTAPSPKQRNKRLERALKDLDSGRNERAVQVLQQVLREEPDDAFGQLALGQALGNLGQFAAAADAFERSAQLAPELADAHFKWAVAKLALGDRAAAIAGLARAAILQPDRFEFQQMLARTLTDAREIPRALGHYHVALALSRNNPQVLTDIAWAQHMLGRTSLALRTIGPAVDSARDDSRTQRIFGTLLSALNRWDEALASTRKAVDLAPKDASARADLAHALFACGSIDEAITQFQSATELDPDALHIHSALVFARMFQLGSTGGDILREAQRFAARHEAPLLARAEAHRNARDPERKLRIGYVAPTFWGHVMSLSTLPLVRDHDRGQFEVYCYASVQQPDAVTQEFRSAATVYRDVLQLDDGQVAELVRSDAIDILVDLNMHMSDSRLAVFARRPAPIQVAHSAYPGTTGLASVDYRVTDPFIEPPGVLGSSRWHELYSERALVLPDSFWIYDPRTNEPAVSSLPALDVHHVRFCSLNALWKINAETSRLWSAVLKALPGSTLTLLAPGTRDELAAGAALSEPQTRLLDIFVSEGIDAGRILFLPRRPRADYLAQYQQFDLALDLLPYNGHMTSLDALWMGVPVITLTGDRLVGRAGSCFAHHLGLSELVANTPDEFVAIAKRLANDLPALAELRQSLRSRLQNSVLMDTRRYVRNLESAYRAAWREWCAPSHNA